MASFAGPAAGQDLAGRVLGTDGDVALRFATRPDVEVCEGGGVRMEGGRHQMGSWRSGRAERCVEGSAELVVTVREGRVRAIDLGPPGTARADRDLGAVGAAAAADWLLALAARPGERAAQEALLPAALADSVEIWPRLLAIARDRSLEGEVRKGALFWVSRAASEVVTDGLAEVAADERDDEQVRAAAVFALSRRPESESVPVLMDVAQTAPGRTVREAALFWLARAEDPRVIGFFEEILLRRTPRR